MSELAYSSILKKIQKKFPNINFVRYYESGISSRTKFLHQIQERFQDISKKDGISLLILTPEELNFIEKVAFVAKTHKKLNSPMLSSIILEEFFENKLKNIGLKLEDVHSLQDFELMKYLHNKTQNLSDNAHSISLPYDVVKINDRIKVNKSLNIILLPHYSVIDMNLFNDIPNAMLKLKEKGIDPEDVYKNTVFHELGHALEKQNALKGFHHHKTNDTILNNINRYRTECIADTFAVFQMARLRGNTDIAEVGMMVRAKKLKDSYKYFKETNNEIKQSIQNDIVKAYGETGFSKEHIEKAISASEQMQMKHLGDHMLYFTVVAIDNARKLADKMLADGTLIKMTDKEVLDLTVKVANKSMFEKNHLISMFYAIINGDTNNEFFDIFNKYTNAAVKYFDIEDKETAAQKKAKQEKKDKHLRSMGFETKENGLDHDKKRLIREKNAKNKSIKLGRTISYKFKSHIENQAKHLLNVFPNYRKMSYPTRHMLYTLELMNFGVAELEKNHEEHKYMYKRRGHDFTVNQGICEGIKDISINGANEGAIISMRQISFEEKFLQPDKADYNGSVYELIAMFVKLHTENIKFIEKNYGNKSDVKFIISAEDLDSNYKKDLANIKYLAKRENKMIKIAQQISQSPDFDEIKDRHSQLYNHICNFKGYRGLVFTSALYNMYYFNNHAYLTLPREEKAIYREIFKQRNCGLLIASKLPKKKQQEFLDIIKAFNGHHIVKNINKLLLQNNQLSNQKA